MIFLSLPLLLVFESSIWLTAAVDVDVVAGAAAKMSFVEASLSPNVASEKDESSRKSSGTVEGMVGFGSLTVSCSDNIMGLGLRTGAGFLVGGAMASDFAAGFGATLTCAAGTSWTSSLVRIGLSMMASTARANVSFGAGAENFGWI